MGSPGPERRPLAQGEFRGVGVCPLARGDVLCAGFPGWGPYFRGVPWLGVAPGSGGSLAQGGPGPGFLP